MLEIKSAASSGNSERERLRGFIFGDAETDRTRKVPTAEAQRTTAIKGNRRQIYTSGDEEERLCFDWSQGTKI